MKYVQLSEVLAQAKTVRAGRDVFPVLSMTMRDGLVPQGQKFKKSVSSADLSGYKVVTRGQLVVGFPIDEGVLSFQQVYDDALVSPAYGVWDLRNPAEVHAPYLEKFLRAPHALAYYKAKLRGSTARRRSLPLSSFAAMPVPLPNVEEQRRIVDVLDKADSLRAKRREAIAHLDSLGQSIFHEMFEDEPINRPLSDAVSSLVGGRNIVGAENSSNPIRVLKISAVTSGIYRESESKPLPDRYQPDDSHIVRAGDVLISRANTTELVGASALVQATNGLAALPDKLWRAEPAHEVLPGFLLATLQSDRVRSEISRRSTGSGGSMKNISKPKLLAIPIAVPALERQKEFDSRIQVIQQLSSCYRQQLAELDNLFLSLQDRAFKGEL